MNDVDNGLAAYRIERDKIDRWGRWINIAIFTIVIVALMVMSG